MKKNILQYLEEATLKDPEHVIFAEATTEITYQTFETKAKTIGSSIARKLHKRNQPIAIFIDKTIQCLEVMMGVIYSGNFYTIIDTNSPMERIESILTTLEPVMVIGDEKSKKKIEQQNVFSNIEWYEELQKEKIEEGLLETIRQKAIDTDPLYVLFTSGSTGIPKGTVVSHRSVIAYTQWVKETFSINEKTIFGSQTPFYFSMSILDVYTTMTVGATLYIIPKMYFSFPVKLLTFLKEKKINTIYWVPSALCIVANLGALETTTLPDLTNILFAGEVMPIKQLNQWRKYVSHARYANLYGPTEVTDICSYYILDREFQDTETLPIGKACNNCDILILKEEGVLAKKGEEGELCVRGSFLAEGYYNNPEKTRQVFTQNPLNTHYPEKIYRTGDIVKENERGEIIYLSRKDFQIKHMGYRIELGEIETMINSIEGIIACCCIYDTVASEIILFYQGDKIDKKEVAKKASEKLLPYMRPNRIEKIEKMPYNANGKIDRTYLKAMAKERI